VDRGPPFLYPKMGKVRIRGNAGANHHTAREQDFLQEMLQLPFH
jgi:hypothetical protein